MQERPTIAVLGGTGDLGSALARRWAATGYRIVIGSRQKEKAELAARELQAAEPAAAVTGEDNLGASRAADVILLAIPYANHAAILGEIKPAVGGKVVVDAVVPLVPPKVSVAQLPAEGSAAQIA